MKKIISVLLALTMLMAVCIPAFAVPNPNDGKVELGEGNDTAIIQTSTTDKDGNNPETWTVTYDATTTIPWNTLVTDAAAKIDYTVDAQLLSTKKLKVTVTTSNDHLMKASNAVETSNDATLDYALKDATTTANTLQTKDFAPICQAVTGSFRIDISAEQWAQAPVAQYQDTITYTVVAE